MVVSCTCIPSLNKTKGIFGYINYSLWPKSICFNPLNLKGYFVNFYNINEHVCRPFLSIVTNIFQKSPFDHLILLSLLQKVCEDVKGLTEIFRKGT